MASVLVNTRIKEYEDAMKHGRKAYNKAVSDGRYPYLPALDQILEQVNVKQEVRLGLVKIPLEQIVGTKNVGRQSCFADNFMPLMDKDSEFGMKWRNVANYHIEKGIGDPIVAYEYMNKFYVLEGNKRVSVLKYFGGDSIEGNVTRILPYPDDTTDNIIYYEFLEFYNDSKINFIYFTKPGSFAQLIEAVGKKKGEKWSEDDRRDLSSAYYRFEKIYDKKSDDKLSITAGDAFLFYLLLYSYEEIQNKTDDQIREDVDRLKVEFTQIGGSTTDENIVLEPEDQGAGAALFSKFFALTRSNTLDVAFIYDRGFEDSGWTLSHEMGRRDIEKIFNGQVRTKAYVLSDESEDIEELLEKVIADKPHLIFTTYKKFLSASLRATVKHPEVKILNCSVGYPYMSMRTYYGRMYEPKFLSGMIAGAVAENDKIAYAANIPSFGTISNINAFALGASMTNPRAKVYLNWNADVNGPTLDEIIAEHDIHVVSGNDIIHLNEAVSPFGLYTVNDGVSVSLAFPMWHWGKFYERIIRDYLQGNWETAGGVSRNSAVNYWWGISSGILDLITARTLPEGLGKLVGTMKNQIRNETFHPFEGVITLQDGSKIGKEGEAPSASEIISMNALVENVIGLIPDVSELNEEGRIILNAQDEFGTASNEGKSETNIQE